MNTLNYFQKLFSLAHLQPAPKELANFSQIKVFDRKIKEAPLALYNMSQK